MSVHENAVSSEPFETSQGSFRYHPLIVVPPIFPHYENSPIPKLLAPIPMIQRALPIIPLTVVVVIVVAGAIGGVVVGIIGGIARLIRGKKRNNRQKYKNTYYGYHNHTKSYTANEMPLQTKFHKKEENRRVSRELSGRPLSLLHFLDTWTERLIKSFNLNDGIFDI
ncbi:hypothetical protein QYM36_002061 [Artemia franciscana]|uniref:Uncharacterized protein n=1 Tax=Artemia franciscana TaxID=6661 RepID=A0AA88LJ12_ARTSF|nr:hypothetical protein QYM36_002061 [Artemia franciscana]